MEPPITAAYGRASDLPHKLVESCDDRVRGVNKQYAQIYSVYIVNLVRLPGPFSQGGGEFEATELREFLAQEYI